jgi:hypothetical protein
VGDKIWATDKWREVFGFEKSQRLDMHRFFQRLHPGDREPVSQTFAELARLVGRARAARR